MNPFLVIKLRKQPTNAIIQVNLLFLTLHVSGDDFVHNQEHLTLFAVSGSIPQVSAGWCHG
jgi:hypothetical protein